MTDAYDSLKLHWLHCHGGCKASFREALNGERLCPTGKKRWEAYFYDGSTPDRHLPVAVPVKPVPEPPPKPILDRKAPEPLALPRTSASRGFGSNTQAPVRTAPSSGTMLLDSRLRMGIVLRLADRGEQTTEELRAHLHSSQQAIDDACLLLLERGLVQQRPGDRYVLAAQGSSPRGT